jgi:hypothetical protein
MRPRVTATGGRFIWIDPRAIDRLEAERRRGEEFSDTIIRLAMADDRSGKSESQKAEREGA